MCCRHAPAPRLALGSSIGTCPLTLPNRHQARMHCCRHRPNSHQPFAIPGLRTGFESFFNRRINTILLLSRPLLIFHTVGPPGAGASGVAGNAPRHHRHLACAALPANSSLVTRMNLPKRANASACAIAVRKDWISWRKRACMSLQASGEGACAHLKPRRARRSVARVSERPGCTRPPMMREVLRCSMTCPKRGV